MAGVLARIKKFFKRKAEEEIDDRDDTAKRVRYISTPGITFTPRQIETKRVRRQCYTYKEIINTTEDRNYEFKAGGAMRNMDHLKDYICKYGPAFLNAEGGVLIGGVTDDGTVEGVEVNSSQERKMINVIESTIEAFRPLVGRDMYRISFLPVNNQPYHRYGSGHLSVVEIYINKGDENAIYENGRHQVFVRRDGGVQGPLRPLSIKDLVIEKYQKILNNRKVNEEANEKLSSINELKENINEEKNSENLDKSCEIVLVKKNSPRKQPSEVGKDKPAQRPVTAERNSTPQKSVVQHKSTPHRSVVERDLTSDPPRSLLDKLPQQPVVIKRNFEQPIIVQRNFPIKRPVASGYF